jgi:hypothetical protein
MKLTIMIVDDGPIPLNPDVPKIGNIRLVVSPTIAEQNIPKKQYLICNLSMPVDFLYVLIREKSPNRIQIITYREKSG